MANRKPLVLVSGGLQQLQAADALSVTLLGGVLVTGAGEHAANGIYYPTGSVRNGEPVRVNPLTGYEMAIDSVVADPSGGGAATLQWAIFRSTSHGTTGAYYGDEASGQPYDSAWNTSSPADIPPWAILPIPTVTQATTTESPADAQVIGISYQYSSTTASANPGSGWLRFNNTNLSSATLLYISETDYIGSSLAAYIATWDDSTSTNRGYLMLLDRLTNILHIFAVTGTNTDNGAWDTVNLTRIAGSGGLVDTQNVYLEFVRTGNVGATGGPGSAGVTGPPNGYIALFTDGSSTHPDPGTFCIDSSGDFTIATTIVIPDSDTINDYAAYLDTWSIEGSSTERGILIVRDLVTFGVAVLRVTGTADTSVSGFHAFPVTFISISGTINSTDQCALQFAATGSSASAISRAALNITATALAASGQSSSSVATIAKVFDVIKVVSSLAFPVRLRVYSSAAFRTADASRGRYNAPTPGSQHGVIMDLILNAQTGYTWIMSPIARGETSDGTNSFYYTVDNLDIVSRNIDLTVTYLKGE